MSELYLNDVGNKKQMCFKLTLQKAFLFNS